MVGRHAALAAAALLVGGLAGVSQAGTIVSFDPDGGGSDGTYQITTIDLKPGNVLAEDVLPALATPGQKIRFEEYFQASVTSLLAGNTQITGIGLGSQYELTVVVKHAGYATFDGVDTLQLRYAHSDDAIIQVWYDASLDANDGAGTGFNNGTKVLEAKVIGFKGNFTVDPTVVALDQHDVVGDSYPGIGTVQGFGGFNIRGNTTYYDPAFFNGNPMNFSLVFPTGNSTLPFKGVEPTVQMWDGTVPNIGAVNGSPLAGGTDVLIQSDASTTFEVPLPASVWGGLVGLVGLAAYRRNRK